MSVFISGKILIQPNTNTGFNFKFPIASSSTVNDGAVPYGRTISSVGVTAYLDGTDVTSLIINGTPQLSGDTVSVVVQYPSTGEGRYKFTFVLTLDNGWTLELDFPNVYVKDH